MSVKQLLFIYHLLHNVIFKEIMTTNQLQATLVVFQHNSNIVATVLFSIAVSDK